MGRHKKNATLGQDVKSFTETKEESLSVFAREVISVHQEIIDLYDVKPVGRSNLIGGERIEHFNEKTYGESLKEAHRWRDDFNLKHTDLKIEFINYYPQEFKHKSVLIGYNLVGTSEGTTHG